MPTNSKRSTSNLTIQNNWRLINGPATITVPDFCLDSLAAFWCSVAYGVKLSYRKFRSIEIIARLPYQPWSSAAYTLLTVFYAEESKAIQLSDISRHARIAQDNEIMHVVVISHLIQPDQGSYTTR